MLVFGRRKREEAAAADAAREAERRALFSKLAERPEAICPFLGLADDRTGYVDGISQDHRCFAFGDPSPISAEQQSRVCEEPGYGNCPRYLRGVLVIPTEELEALRRPRAAAEAPAAPPAAPPEERARRRRGPILAVLLLLLLVGGGLTAFLALNGDPGVAVATPTVAPTPTAPVTEEPTPIEAPTVTPKPTPVVLPSAGSTIPPLPTPQPDAEATGFVVVVTAGEFPLRRINDDGTVGDQATGIFSRVSGAPVQRVEIDGVTYWVTLIGLYEGLAYVDGFSGGPEDFAVFEAYENQDGSAGFIEVPPQDR